MDSNSKTQRNYPDFGATLDVLNPARPAVRRSQANHWTVTLSPINANGADCGAGRTLAVAVDGNSSPVRLQRLPRSIAHVLGYERMRQISGRLAVTLPAEAVGYRWSASLAATIDGALQADGVATFGGECVAVDLYAARINYRHVPVAASAEIAYEHARLDYMLADSRASEGENRQAFGGNWLGLRDANPDSIYSGRITLAEVLDRLG